MSWQEKVHQHIAAMCMESYRRMNTTKNGTPRKKHAPYSVPALAQALVECLKTHDEARAKALMLVEGDIAQEYKQ